MGKECGTWVSRRLWGGGNTSPLKTTAWEARVIVAYERRHTSGCRFSPFGREKRQPEIRLHSQAGVVGSKKKIRGNHAFYQR